MCVHICVTVVVRMDQMWFGVDQVLFICVYWLAHIRVVIVFVLVCVVDRLGQLVSGWE